MGRALEIARQRMIDKLCFLEQVENIEENKKERGQNLGQCDRNWSIVEKHLISIAQLERMVALNRKSSKKKSWKVENLLLYD